jgi:hypothetical protein
MGCQRAVLIGVLFITLISGIAYMMPVVDVGVSKNVFNSTTGTDVLYNFAGADYLNGSLNIFDQSGSLVRSIDTGVHTNGNYNLHWEGDYGNGTSVPDGIYTINSTMALDHYMMTGKVGNPFPAIPKHFFPLGLAVNASGYIFVSNIDSLSLGGVNSIYVYRPDGSFFTDFTSDLTDPIGMVISIGFNSSGFIYAVNYVVDASGSTSNVIIFYPNNSYYGKIDKSSTGTSPLIMPSSVAFNSSGYAYVLDVNGIVFTFTPDGKFLNSWRTIDTDVSSTNTPFCIAIDALDRVFISEPYNDSVKKFDSSGAFIAQWTNFNRPNSICVDNASLVYVLDSAGTRVQALDGDGTVRRSWSVVRSGISSVSPFLFLAFDGTTGHFLMNDIRQDDLTSPYVGSVIVTQNDGTPVMTLTRPSAAPGDLYKVNGVAVNASGYTYTLSNDLIQVYDPDGEYVFGWSYPFIGPEFSSQMPSAGIYGIAGIAINRSGYVYIADYNRVLVFDSGGNFVRKWTVLDPPNFMDTVMAIMSGDTIPSVKNICLGPDDSVYTTSKIGLTESFTDPYTIRVFNPDGERLNFNISSTGLMENVMNLLKDMYNSILTNNGTLELDETTFLSSMMGLFQTTYYNGIAVNSSGSIYSTMKVVNAIVIYNTQGQITGAFNGTMAGAGEFNDITGISINASDCVFILDSGNNRVVVLDRNNSFLTQFGATGTGDGQFRSPQGLCVYPSDANVVVADTGNNRTQTFEYFGRYYDQVQVTVDNTPPVITGAPTTAASVDGWFNGPVTVHFSANDATSGLQSCTGDQVLSGEGANQSVMGTAVDRAGNTNATAVKVSIDLTAPVISCSLSGDLTGDGRLGQVVKATLGTNDSLSGVDSVKYSFDNIVWTTYSGTFTVPFGDPRTLYYMVTDKAGNSASGSSYLNFAPASYFSSSAMPLSLEVTLTPTITPVPSPTPATNSTASPEVSPAASMSESEGNNPMISTNLLMAILALLVVTGLAAYFIIFRQK